VIGLVEPTPQTLLFSGILRKSFSGLWSQELAINHAMESFLWTLFANLDSLSGTAINHSLELVSYKMKHPSFHISVE